MSGLTILSHSVSLQHPLCTGMFRPPKLRVQLSLDRLEQCDVQCQYYRREVQESEQVRHDLLKQEVCSMFFGALYTVCTLYSLYCFPTYTPVFQVQFMHFVCIYTMYLQALYNVYMYKHVLRIYPHTHCRLWLYSKASGQGERVESRGTEGQTRSSSSCWETEKYVDSALSFTLFCGHNNSKRMFVQWWKNPTKLKKKKRKLP